jgi:acetyltransferase-like isoleucine patch superfamily enzyme
VEVGEGVSLGPSVHLGRGARVGTRALVARAAVLPQVDVAAGSTVVGAVVAPDVGIVSP